MRDHRAQTLLAQASTFVGLKPTEIRRLLDAGKLITLPQGGTVCACGEPSRQVFILLEGTLDACSRDGTPVVRLEPVQTAGEVEFISRRPWSTSLKAASSAHLVEIGFGQLDVILDADPGLATRLYRNFIRVLGDRLSAAHDAAARYRRCVDPAGVDGAGSLRGDAAPGASRPPRPAREHVVAFYHLLRRLPGPDDLAAGEAIVGQLRRDGFSDADIAYATEWTARHIPSARRYELVKLSVQEALEEKWNL